MQEYEDVRQAVQQINQRGRPGQPANPVFIHVENREPEYTPLYYNSWNYSPSGDIRDVNNRGISNVILPPNPAIQRY